MNALQLIYRYYPEDNALRRLLIRHSRQVEQRALLIAGRHPELGLNAGLLSEGALVHDIGIYLTDAPGIHCFGTHHYLLHGCLGAEIMRREGREDLARICERHTGTGLRAKAFAEKGLPVPGADLLPETLVEKVVCYADKFYSKSHPKRERSVSQTAAMLERFGEESVATFLGWARMFE